MKLIQLLGLLFILGGSLCAQAPQLQLAEDLNGDGIIDSIFSRSEYRDYDVWAVEGKSNAHFKASLARELWNFLVIVPLDSSLFLAHNRPLREAMERTAFREAARDKADGSLQWLFSAYQSPVLDTPSTHFSYSFRFAPQWQAGPMEMPDNYHIEIDQGQLFGLMKRVGQDGQFQDSASWGGGWVSYAGKFHENRNWPIGGEDLKGGRSASQYSGSEEMLITTHHGVVLENSSQHKWCFVNDAMLTSGPDKLRFGSVQKAVYGEGLIFILTMGAGFEYHLFVVEPKLGICGFFLGWPDPASRYDPVTDSNAKPDIEFSQGRLIVRYGGKKEWNCAEIKEELSAPWQGNQPMK